MEALVILGFAPHIIEAALKIYRSKDSLDQVMKRIAVAEATLRHAAIFQHHEDINHQITDQYSRIQNLRSILGTEDYNKVNVCLVIKHLSRQSTFAGRLKEADKEVANGHDMLKNLLKNRNIASRWDRACARLSMTVDRQYFEETRRLLSSHDFAWLVLRVSVTLRINNPLYKLTQCS